MEKEYKRILDFINVGIYYVDINKDITFWNKSAENITGFKSVDVIGKCCAENILRHIDDKGVELCIQGCPLGETLKDGKEREGRVYLHHKDGHRVPVTISITAIYNEKKEIVGAVEIFTDITNNLDIIKELEKLKEEVFTDQLTQVGNRKYAEHVLEQKINDWETFNVPFTIYFIDIDHFKKINDTYGHNIGDSVLKMVAKSILTAMRPFDTVCRWGGEEFIVIVPNIEKSTVKPVGERIRKLIENSWFEHNAKTIKVTASLGCSMVKANDSILGIIERSDKAMYNSKQNGRNRVSIF